MAKIKYSALVSSMSGKLNGSVLTKNKSGYAIRNKTTPINRRTSYQSQLRANFAQQSKVWATLTESQINAWNAAAAQVSRTNIFGDKIQNSGFNLFMECNRNLFTAGQTAITDVPANFSCEGGGLASVNADTDPSEVFTITGDDSTVPAGHTALIFVTPQLSPGVSNVSGKYVLLKTIAAGQSLAAISILTEYKARFGALVQGKTIGVGLNFVNNTNGAKKVIKFKAGSDLASKVK